MHFTKAVLFVCLVLCLANLCSASPSDRQSKQEAEELANVIQSGFNSAYQIGRFLIHGENMKNNP